MTHCYLAQKAHKAWAWHWALDGFDCNDLASGFFTHAPRLASASTPLVRVLLDAQAQVVCVVMQTQRE